MKSVNYKYEPHILPDARLPYLYHGNLLISDSKMIANWHRNIEFLRFYSGTGRVICDGESFDVKKGDVFVANSNCMHAVHSDTGVTYQCLIIDSDFCQENGIDTDKIVFRSIIDDDALAEKFDEVAREINSDNEFRNAAIRSTVLDFLVYLSRNYIEKDAFVDNRVKKNAVENIKIATVYIKSRIDQKLTLDEIAAQTGLSKFHFAREFKKIVGMTTVNYINILKCERARKMLSSGNFLVHEVQELCGFENASYFTKVFKRFCGFSPMEYMKIKDE